MALRLTLKPGERIAVNGAVLVNGDRRASLLIENQARILREKDIMRPEEADTPAKRVYLAVLLMALDPAGDNRLRADYETRLGELAGALVDPSALRLCAGLGAAVANRNYYNALSLCRRLIEIERARLAHVA
jgi:flagellar protein FlbT